MCLTINYDLESLIVIVTTSLTSSHGIISLFSFGRASLFSYCFEEQLHVDVNPFFNA